MNDTEQVSCKIPPLNAEQIRWRWKILTATYFSYAGYYLCRKAFSICKKSIGDEFSLDALDLANIWTAFLIAYMVGQFLNGILGRKMGPRLLLLTGMAISLGCNVVFGFANSYATFIGFMILNGLAQASGWPGNVGGIAHWLRKEERGLYMGVWSTNYLAGNVGVKFIAGFMLTYAGWRYSFWACSLGMAVIWLLFYFFHRNRPEDVGLPPIVTQDEEVKSEEAAEAEARAGAFLGFFRVLTNPVVVLMGITYFTLKFLRYALDSWLPYFLSQSSFQVEGDIAAYYSSVFDLAGFAGVILSGWALDKVFKGNWRLLCAIMTAGMTIAYILVIQYGYIGPFTLACLYGLVGFMLYGPDTILNGAGAVATAGPRDALSAVGVIDGIGSIGPIVQEQVIGRIYRYYGSYEPFKIICVYMSATTTLLLLLLILQAWWKNRSAGRSS
ncbi:MAG TPA: MFS transporter [bacterium]|nr:MFS transporter [bacterium]HQL61707.1 MFS transporter [bacterium]